MPVLSFQELDQQVRQGDLTRTDDGVRLHLPRSEEWKEKLEAFAQAFSKFFPVDASIVDDDANSGLVLDLRAGEETRQFVEKWFAGTSAVAPRQGPGGKFRFYTRHMRRLPDFVIVGVARCGTTSLFHAIARHPRVRVATTKEIDFFSFGFARGLGYYRRFFPLVGSQVVNRLRGAGADLTGEASPSYFCDPRVPERIRTSVPNVKLFVTLRCPVERAFSHHQASMLNGWETLSFEDAIDREEERLEGERERMLADPSYAGAPLHFFSYKQMGIYVDVIEHWLRSFPREQLHIVSCEEMVDAPDRLLDGVWRFLGVPPGNAESLGKTNALPRGKMAPATRERLREYFRPHNRRLADLLGRDFGWDG